MIMDIALMTIPTEATDYNYDYWICSNETHDVFTHLSLSSTHHIITEAYQTYFQTH